MVSPEKLLKVDTLGFALHIENPECTVANSHFVPPQSLKRA